MGAAFVAVYSCEGSGGFSPHFPCTRGVVGGRGRARGDLFRDAERAGVDHDLEVRTAAEAVDRVVGVRIALAGVAPVPWTLDAPASLYESTPLPGTAYKVEIARALVRRALEGVAPQW